MGSVGKQAKPRQSAGGLVEAVVLLRPARGGRLPTPEESKAAAHSVLEKASKSTGLKPDASTVFESMNSFSVRAPQALIDAIAQDAAVSEIVPNELPESPLIQPVKKKYVKLGG